MCRPQMFRGLSFIAAAILLLCTLQFVAAAQTAATPAMQRANELLQAKRWAEAAQAYEAIVKATPDNARAWYQLATARYSLEQFALAADAYQKNISLNKNPFAMFNLACVYARMNEKDKAIEWLSQAFGPDNKAPYLLDLNDPDLNSLHNDPRYKALWLAADKRNNPCLYRAEARQFDFWIGEWDAFDRQGRKDGTSVIERIAGGCGILENWTNAAGGGGGKSINFYDLQANKWFQYWIGADGNPGRYSGVYQDGALRYEGEAHTQNGKKIISRLTFFNVDATTVRQLSEQSDDDGKTWMVGYDLKYVRRSPASSVSPGR